MWKIAPRAFGALVTAPIIAVVILVQGFTRGFWEPGWLVLEMSAVGVFCIYAWRRLWRRAAREDGTTN
jgi:hypothetical protein